MQPCLLTGLHLFNKQNSMLWFFLHYSAMSMCVFCISAAIDFFQLFNSDPCRLYASKTSLLPLDDWMKRWFWWLFGFKEVVASSLADCHPESRSIYVFRIIQQFFTIIFFFSLSSFSRGCKVKYSQYIYNDFSSDTYNLSLFVTDI